MPSTHVCLYCVLQKKISNEFYIKNFFLETKIPHRWSTSTLNFLPQETKNKFFEKNVKSEWWISFFLKVKLSTLHFLDTSCVSCGLWLYITRTICRCFLCFGNELIKIKEPTIFLIQNFCKTLNFSLFRSFYRFRSNSCAICLLAGKMEEILTSQTHKLKTVFFSWWVFLLLASTCAEIEITKSEEKIHSCQHDVTTKILFFCVRNEFDDNEIKYTTRKKFLIATN